MQPLPVYLYPGPSLNSFSSTDGRNRSISCNQIKLQTRAGPAPAWFQQAALDPSSYNFKFCTCAGTYKLQVHCGCVCAFFSTNAAQARHLGAAHTCCVLCLLDGSGIGFTCQVLVQRMQQGSGLLHCGQAAQAA